MSSEPTQQPSGGDPAGDAAPQPQDAPQPALPQAAPQPQDVSQPQTAAPQPQPQAAPRSHVGAAAAAPPRPLPPTRTGPRTGPIVWGALILAFCGYVVQLVFGGGELDGVAWLTITTIGLGVILLVVGAAVIIRNRRR
ncbi:hypothetical protein [Leucobacter luti]|uniref:Uncharacterized protein n=1 Tax=Leucobacter luti TaxID=340320 RepID=A0A4Q7TYW4_9MICO|nr:hypothetical protein [Leucobacter luti]MBL3698937.1 hypothetical protein [Leucobacter luti]RZT66315.1 hypothetical protein EV139_1751 [Leucobacter luti]